MGLDGVELLMAFEEAFGVSITDGEAEKMLTPRLAGDMIFLKLEATDKATCQSQRAFYLLRKAMMQRIKLARPTFTPDLAYRSLVPASQHRQFWEELRLEVRARSWPSLVRPWWLSIVLIIGNLTIGVYIFMLVCAFSPVLWWLSVMMMIVVGIVMARLTKRFKTRIPYRCRKIRSIVPYAVTSEQIKWTREQVSAVVKQVVQEQLALSDVQYREDAHFIKDLGLGR